MLINKNISFIKQLLNMGNIEYKNTNKTEEHKELVRRKVKLQILIQNSNSLYYISENFLRKFDIVSLIYYIKTFFLYCFKTTENIHYHKTYFGITNKYCRWYN